MFVLISANSAENLFIDENGVCRKNLAKIFSDDKSIIEFCKSKGIHSHDIIVCEITLGISYSKNEALRREF